MWNVAVDFGGTHIKVGLLSEEGSLIAQTRLPARSGAGLLPRLPDVGDAVEALLGIRGICLGECAGVGIALPGLVDPDSQTLLAINAKYADAVGFPFEDWVRERFGLSSVLENDARAALIGETAYGSARGETDAVLMIFGTGIGTAAMMGGRIVRGRHHQAGVLGGHLVTNVHGRACTCGNIGCLEAQAAHWALPALVRERPELELGLGLEAEEWGYKEAVQAGWTGHAAAAGLLDELFLHWSAGIVNLVHAYDPECVILSGGLMKSARDVLPRLEETVRRRAWTDWGEIRFKAADNPDASVLLGLAALLNGSDKKEAAR